MMATKKINTTAVTRAVFLSLVASCVSSCALLSSSGVARPMPIASEHSHEQWAPVIENLIGVVVQLIPPGSGDPVYVSHDEPLSNIAVELLREEGFVFVPAGELSRVDLEVQGVDVSSRYEYIARFEVEIFGIKVSREYTVDRSGSWSPISSVFVSGSSRPVLVDDSMVSGDRPIYKKLSVVNYSERDI